MARVLVSLEDARAVVADVSQYGDSFLFGALEQWRVRTVVAHLMRRFVDNLAGGLDGEAGPLLHGRAVNVLLRMLQESALV